MTATVNKLEAVLPVLKQRVDIRELLYSHETGSKANYLEILQAYVESQQELAVQKSRLQESAAAVAAITEARAQTAAEFRRTLFSELVEAERKASGLSEDLVKATQRTQLQALTAPVDGAVQQLSVHTIGGVVTPAQALLMVVPSDSHLEVEAMLSNRDIGFVHPGQDVEIKVDTFPFTRYGLIHGRVVSVSQDAITRDKPQAAGDRRRARERLERAERARNWSIPRASRSTARRCKWRKISSTSPPAWRSRWRSRPGRAPSSPTCCRRSCATSRRACGRGEPGLFLRLDRPGYVDRHQKRPLALGDRRGGTSAGAVSSAAAATASANERFRGLTSTAHRR